MALPPLLECQTVTYARAIQSLEENYQISLGTGRFRVTSFPASYWNLIVLIALIAALYTIPACAPAVRAGLRYAAFAAVSTTSVWSLCYHRAPGVPGSLGVGLNAFMCTVFATNFLILREPQDIRRIAEKTAPTDDKGHSLVTGNTETKWEHVPDHVLARLYWTIDLIACLRAVKWSWTPRSSTSKLISAPQDLAAFCKRQLFLFLCTYLALDIIKCMMIADPHFLGYNCPPPSHLVHMHWLALHCYRLLITAVGITCAIQCYFSAWALFQVGILGPKMLGLNGLPCMYPPLYGSPEAVFQCGLRGFWSETWHQIFRTHFASVADAFTVLCFGSPPTSRHRRFVRLSAVFIISGFFHACAAISLLGNAQPFNAFLCFAAQPVGIALQGALSKRAQHLTQSTNTARWANFSFVLVWLCLTFTPLSNAFARGGTWLFEPCPFSIIRGLGLSSQDKRWFPVFGHP